MKSLNTLREERGAKVAEMRGLTEAAQAGNRDLEEAERGRFDALEGEVRSLTAKITDAEKIAEFERFEARGERVDGEMTRELRGYSVAKAINESGNGRLTGLEAECHAELSRGREARGVMIPTEVLLERRDLTTTTPAGGPGGNLVATGLGPLSDRRRSALKVEGLGATVLQGLTGNLDLPRLSQSGTVAWVAENTDATRSDPRFSKVSMGPKAVSAEYVVGRRMRLQSSVAMEPILRADLAYLLMQALDGAAIKGGGANEPDGILETGGVVQLADANIGSDLAADLIAELELDDVTGTTAFLTHPAVLARARKVKDTTGRLIPLGELFHGKPVENTTQVPISTPAASPAPAKYPLIYGEWASLVIGYWSGVDLLVNPYHSAVASKGGVLIHAFLDADVVARHPEGFVWAEVN